MHDRIRGLRFARALFVAGAVSVAVSACGSSSSSSSGNATHLLQQTFSGSHVVTSGDLNFTVTMTPSGSTTLTGPITFSFGGPFQSLGKGKLPQSNFNVSISALGKSGSLGILSTGTAGYVTLKGTSYQLPAATFQRLESSFAQLASSPGGGSGSGTLSKLGINPLHWLTNPSVVGSESVGGAATTHIRAGVNVSALLDDLNTFLQKASSLGGASASRLPSSISSATRTRIASAVQNPSFDVWTGSSDKTVRKLAINLTLPVTGQISAALGGLRSAAIGVSMEYANLNQPQTIVAPTTVRPYSEFAAKARVFVQAIQSAVAGGLTGSASSGSGSSGSPASVQGYSQCISAAGGDVAKMQKCASLLSGK
jgi:hypothetical protein